MEKDLFERLEIKNVEKLETMKNYRIYVHGGKAHADDTWACGVLIASVPGICTEIIRDQRAWQHAEPEDYIVDVGYKYDGQHCFDHHQLESTPDVPCALTLVCRAFAPWLLDDLRYGPVFERIRVQDNFGLPVSDKQFGPSAPYTQAEWDMVADFEENPLETAKRIARAIQRRKKELGDIESAKTWLAEHSVIEMVGPIRTLTLSENPYAIYTIPAFNNACDALCAVNRVEIVYGFDPGTEGSHRTIFRTRFAGGGIDLRRCQPETPVFRHKNGFLLIFDPVSSEEYKELIRQSMF